MFLMGFEMLFDLNVLFFSGSSKKTTFCLFFTSDILSKAFLLFCLTILRFLAVPSIIYRSLTKFYSHMPSSSFKCCYFYGDSFSNPIFSSVFLLRDPGFLPLFFRSRTTPSFWSFVAFGIFLEMVFLFLSTFCFLFLSGLGFFF